MKNRSFSKCIAWLTGLGFFLLLLCLMALTLFQKPAEVSYYENRKLNGAPAFSLEGVLDGSFFSGAEEYLRDRSAGRERLLLANTYLDLKLLKRPVVNGVLVSGEKVLAYHDYEPMDQALFAARAEEAASGIQSAAEATKKAGGRYYYMAIPSQSVAYAESYPSMLNSSYEIDTAQVAALAKALEERGISFVDMGKEDWKKEYLSVVDHHYLLPGILHSYRTLIDRINADTDFDLKLLAEEDYEIKTLPNPHIGSRSRKLMGLFSTEEKVSYLEMREQIAFDRYDYGGKAESTVVSLPQNAEQEVAYAIYMGGDFGATRIETHREELPSILIYGDSFTNGLESVIWQNFNTMYSYDLRHYTEKTIEECIEEYQPDIVVYLRNYSDILKKE